ncbi:multifunctional 2',3'-cyclic-nucleotide 2'-phosphodiesterase/5'-nucleotidase/3'-nucleotidase [Clostridium tetani]|uniref:5'-nucleotidase C-terminal domain-containing protein n=1 Tax=Clostridium tetani TaxID=1513 RepID=UPI002955D213|nr:5'-nucleotidase C-terminal domain-containing protein [Clostridium tetani]BDR67774.1 multifunctional 2',3'-cyclic-nucleotide 2'-phosphodiesterase/5'-nucleotidase/3'-nucleotidase [Clostridium tetani]BDR70405.1 multifunctional 2',3'-cyclic-nucleotide 2'-phosphodiesterase/5'-nucleotidase/3'-nucleotidase [Clostridium tetani]BDR73198.1 multifunctional 2',3'-cyclic-nucleotide 2'-phosphodiesterase/5'-nucleotidase/3'-nucleotidase [Clostridium tetani]BEV20043.1 5'-nucleotidase C-terminal domain-contai
MFKERSFKKISSWLVAIFMMLNIFMPMNTVSASELANNKEDSNVKTINIVTLNDYHGLVKEAGKDIGIAKFTETINEFKKENPNTIVLGAGDLFQGTALSNLNYGAPINEMVKELGVIASAVGNHEFDWGIDKIAKWAKEGGYEWLASNIYDKKTGEPVTWAKPYKMLEVDGVKIGLIGLATPETAYKTKPSNVEGLEFRDPIKAGKEWADKLRKGEVQEGRADIIIAVTHLGSIQDKKTKEITGEAADLAKANVGIDAIISGHTHMTVAGEVNKTPIVQAYKNGRAFGKLEIKYNINNKKVSIKPEVVDLASKVKDLKESEAGKKIVEKYENASKDKLNEVVGHTKKDLPHERFEGPSLLGEWVCEAMAKTTKSQIAITNGGGLRCPINKGDITVGILYQLMPFDNTLVTMEVKGSDIKKIVENGIGNESIGWAAISGLKVKYDLKQPFGNRIHDIKLSDGKEIDMNKYYTLVTNDFMSEGGDNFDFTSAKNKVDTNLPIRDALIKELRDVKTISVDRKNYLEAGTKPQVKPQPKPEIKPSQKKVVYKVKSGDSLYRIGKRYKIDYKTIAKDNGIKNPNLIFIGQKIIINVN